MLIRIFLRYFPRCYDEQCIPRKQVRDYFIFSPSALETRFYRRVKESRRLRLFSNLRNMIYITARDRSECKPPWNPNSPRGKQRSKVLSMLAPWTIIKIVTTLLILNDFYIHIDKRRFLENLRWDYPWTTINFSTIGSLSSSKFSLELYKFPQECIGLNI